MQCGLAKPHCIFYFRHYHGDATSTRPGKAMQRQKYKIIIFGCAFTCWQFASDVNADTEFSKMLDCTEIELEAVIDQDASRKDNLARLSKQFFQSVNTIEHCNRAQNRDDAAPSTDSDSVSSNISANQAWLALILDDTLSLSVEGAASSLFCARLQCSIVLTDWKNCFDKRAKLSLREAS